jgi:hypothetical protein
MYLTRLVALALGVLSFPALAQSDSAAKPARLLTHTFANPSREFVRVRLESAVSYRVQVNRAQVKLEVRPVSLGVQPPRVREILAGEKLRVFLLEPRVTAEYELRVLGAEDRPVQLTVDRRASKP